jgi:hypothetical protein
MPYVEVEQERNNGEQNTLPIFGYEGKRDFEKVQHFKFLRINLENQNLFHENSKPDGT